MTVFVIIIVLVALILVGLAKLSHYKPPRCVACRDGFKIEHLPEFGVYGTSLCVHCNACGAYYVLEATSREIRTIDEKTARRDYKPRDGAAHE